MIRIQELCNINNVNLLKPGIFDEIGFNPSGVRKLNINVYVRPEFRDTI